MASAGPVPIIRLNGQALDFDASSLDRQRYPGDLEERWTLFLGIDGAKRNATKRVEALDRIVYPIWAARGVVALDHESEHSTLHGRCRVDSIGIERGHARVGISVHFGGVGPMTRTPKPAIGKRKR